MLFAALLPQEVIGIVLFTMAFCYVAAILLDMIHKDGE